MKTLMQYKLHIIAFLLTVGVLVGLVTLSPKAAPLDPNEITLFYGNTCPHCKILEDFIKENGIEEKIVLTRREVYDNPGNAGMLARAARSCGIKSNSFGVPFIYAEGKCYVGGDEAKNYLIEKVGLTDVKESTVEFK